MKTKDGKSVSSGVGLLSLSDLRINQYQISGGTAESSPNDVVLHRMPQISGPDLWAIQEMSFCFNRDGEWEYEPQPSSRTAEYLNRCRFSSEAEAVNTWNAYNGRSRFDRR